MPCTNMMVDCNLAPSALLTAAGKHFLIAFLLPAGARLSLRQHVLPSWTRSCLGRRASDANWRSNCCATRRRSSRRSSRTCANTGSKRYWQSSTRPGPRTQTSPALCVQHWCEPSRRGSPSQSASGTRSVSRSARTRSSRCDSSSSARCCSECKSSSRSASPPPMCVKYIFLYV